MDFCGQIPYVEPQKLVPGVLYFYLGISHAFVIFTSYHVRITFLWRGWGEVISIWYKSLFSTSENHCMELIMDIKIVLVNSYYCKFVVKSQKKVSLTLLLLPYFPILLVKSNYCTILITVKWGQSEIKNILWLASFNWNRDHTIIGYRRIPIPVKRG